MRNLALCLSLLCIALPAVAQTTTCTGSDPAWKLSLDQTEAFFTFRGETANFDVANVTTAEGAESPRAITLISNFDSAILILDARQCGDADIAGHVLTQERNLPIMLTGCCRADD